ncbi:MAG TPA: winged helix-turn-helix domain-containing protein [Thermoanaerobaculia bacterium]
MPGKKESTSRPAGLEQMRALSHPLRLRLLEVFAERPRTTKQAAEALGEPTTKLYHHVAALERAGLVRLRETRQNRGTTEKYFEVTQNQFLAKTDAALLQNEEAQAVMGFVLFDQAREELVRALSSGQKPGSVLAVRGILRLSRAEAKRLRKELVALVKRVSKACESEPGPRTRRRRYTLTIALLPADRDGGEA